MKRNDKVRHAIQMIVDAQRHSSEWMSISDWTDLIERTLKFASQWGHNIQIWNRQIGIFLTKHPAFAKTYDKGYDGFRSFKTPMYMIDLADVERGEKLQLELRLTCNFLMPEKKILPLPQQA